jgi:germination protein M
MKKSLILILIILILLLLGSSIIYLSSQKGVDERTGNTQEVKLYFSDEEAMYLVPEIRTVEKASTPGSLYTETLNLLIDGPKSAQLNATIPEGVKLLSIEVKNGTAYVNFNQALVDNHWGGSAGELMTVYSIVDTITQFPGIKSAQILIEGKEIVTLAGHMDLTEPLSPDPTMIKKE